MNGKIKEMRRQNELMTQLAESGYYEDRIEDLLSLTSMVVDFCYCLQQTHVDESYRSDTEYNCNSLFAVVDTFTQVSSDYYCLIGSETSNIDWGDISVSSIKKLIDLTYKRFESEPVFLKKCRYLLDLYKMGLVFAGLVYGNPE